MTTPLLMTHGDKDEAVPYAQATELYMALRRAGEKAWLLEYKDAGHILYGANAVDFNIRIRQFFDHYLKGAPPAKWMTGGDGRYGYGLDMSGANP